MAQTNAEAHLQRVLKTNDEAQTTYEGLDPRAKLAILHHWQGGYRVLFAEVFAALEGNELATRMTMHLLLTVCMNQTFKEVKQLLDEAGYYEGRKQAEAEIARRLSEAIEEGRRLYAERARQAATPAVEPQQRAPRRRRRGRGNPPASGNE